MFTGLIRRRQLPAAGVAIFLAIFFAASALQASDPDLPSGLGGDKQSEKQESGPDLPSGLDSQADEPKAASEPGLPAGLGEQPDSGEPEGGTAERKDRKAGKWKIAENLEGYAELRAGRRIHDDPVHDSTSLAEARFQLSWEKRLQNYLPRGRFKATGDFIFDATVSDHDDADLEEGSGFFDLREFRVFFTPLDFVDISAGRQIFTWGTGNLVFLNDLFPKDYRSFFLGRDLEYLKAPSDAVRMSFYTDALNFEIVYTPCFDSDRFVDGSGLSFYDPSLPAMRGEDNPIDTDRPDDWFEDDEIALRAYRNINSWELAAYGYHGFWKSPSGTDPDTGRRIFPELSVLGASLRGPIVSGIANAEFAWYDSRDDRHGDDPYVKNSQYRFLAGYEQELISDLTMGLQYYVEYMIDYDRYKESLPPSMPAGDRAGQWVTIDLTQTLMAQDQLVLSLFTFYSLNEKDFYLGPKAEYDLTDELKIQAGANIFIGGRTDFFGTFEESSNIYAAVRYGF
ncbi:MAG: hypothetical protein K9J85_10780 [Desulfobacteraceae bacterium]|nr:hypothetical protein [Desulfobacteraceae bacterium]